MKKIKVLFENKNLTVFDKPADFVIGKDGEFEIGKKKYVAVHRLDKDTTGCLVVAKNPTSFENLKDQFKNKKIKKEYIALVWGFMKHDTGMIDSAIARSKSDFRKKEVVRAHMALGVDGPRVVTSNNNKFRGEEREAMTRYKVLKREIVNGEKITFVAFYPETGRTHQIRIHSKSIGHPILGDHLYGPMKKSYEKKIFGKFPPRQLLHAKAITLHNPDGGELIKIESPIPADFDLILKSK